LFINGNAQIMIIYNHSAQKTRVVLHTRRYISAGYDKEFPFIYW